MRINESGFTLLELLIVLAIVGLVMIVAVPSITNTFRFSVQSSAREIATLIKDSSNSAQVTGKIHRIVYDLKNEQYWVESTSDDTLMQSEESRAWAEDHAHDFKKKDTEEEEKKKNGGFHQESSLTKKKRTLPIGVKFKDVVTEQQRAPITEGLAYTHIFPQGITELTLVHLTDTGTNEVSLIVSNLLGRCSVEGHYIEPAEVFKK